MNKEELIEKGYTIYNYSNGDYKYKDENEIEHLFSNGKEICKGNFILGYFNGDYKYQDEEGIHYIKNEDIENE